ncbi:hypothetical protein [Haliangium sp.]|uniref:hypothetical protein n=1 Tax=Haliangium sp. TaxID=2663208 RepID=UPI003D0C1B1A
MPAFDITAQTGDQVPLDRRGHGQATFLVVNRLGRRRRARIRIEFESAAEAEPARAAWLEADKSEHAFAPGGSAIVTVTATVPPDTPAGRYGFRIAVEPADADEPSAADKPADESADADKPDDKPDDDRAESITRSAPVWLRHGAPSPRRIALFAGLIGAALAAVAVYAWVIPPACEVDRAVYDRDAQACVCPTGMAEASLGDRRQCVCAAGTAYDDAGGTCVERACATERALYAEAIAACSCPPGTNELDLDGRKRCACARGKVYDPATRTCLARACESPQRSLYDDGLDRCVCPTGMALETAPDGGEACVCAPGTRYQPEGSTCVSVADVSIELIRVFPPLILNRQFDARVTILNRGDTDAGPFRFEISITGGGVTFTDQVSYPGLQANSSLIYERAKLRTGQVSDLRIEARVIPLDFEDGDADNDVAVETLPVAPRRPLLTDPR